MRNLILERRLVYLRVLRRQCYTLLKKDLEKFEVLREDIFAQLQIQRILYESLRFEIIPKLRAMFSEWRRIGVERLVLPFDVISDPFLKYFWKSGLQQLLIDLCKFRIKLKTVVLLNHELLAKCLVYERIVNVELVVPWLQERGKYIVAVTRLLKPCEFIENALWLVDVVH